MVEMDYKNYWSNENWEKREKRQYYQKLYSRVKSRIAVPADARVLDVGGGDGHFTHFLGIKNENVDIIDISDSGRDIANRIGFKTINADIEKRFPFPDAVYDAALCFEVLEHLCAPDITLSETNRVLKPNGILYVGQPNMRADGVHHLRRFYLQNITGILEQNGFKIEWVDFVPAFTMRDAIIDDIKKQIRFLEN